MVTQAQSSDAAMIELQQNSRFSTTQMDRSVEEFFQAHNDDASWVLYQQTTWVAVSSSASVQRTSVWQRQGELHAAMRGELARECLLHRHNIDSQNIMRVCFEIDRSLWPDSTAEAGGKITEQRTLCGAVQTAPASLNAAVETTIDERIQTGSKNNVVLEHVQRQWCRR
jgi:hypothetical protein